MRRNPFTLLAVLGSFYIYYALREAGHLVSALALGLEVSPAVRYRVLPGFDVWPGAAGITLGQAGVVILSGPILALAAGYILLSAALARCGRLLHPVIRLMLGLLCYLALVLDPIYYAVIPLFRLGGEPEAAAHMLSIPTLPMALAAMAILVFNVYLLQKWVIPLIRGNGAEDRA